ncbi:MAG: beta-lactamase family protein [Acidobacteria bacterium]|nr:beta-lactamase family protein [Acidobacteriota bacterium]
MIRCVLAFVLVLLTGACGGASQAPSAPAAPVAAAAPTLASLSVADLDAFIGAVVVAQRAIGVNVGVMRDGQVVFAKGYGLARVADQTPVATDTLFAIGSITKQFTCAVALQLEQERKLSFDDKVVKYEPDLTRAADITLGDIGGMVSGYRDYYPLDFVDRPMAAPRPGLDIVRDFASRPLDFEPRARYSYSNTGYLLLGAISERAGREPFAAQLERRLLTPLGLNRTRYEPARGGDGMAEGYTPLGLGDAEPAVPEGNGWIGAAGGLWSTPSDLLTWDLALMEGKVLSPASWARMTTPHALTDGRTSGYGCGQSIRDRGAVLVVQHGGAVSGFGARNAMVPSSRSAVVVMANADWAGGVLDAIEGAVLEKLMPQADAPAVSGPPARDLALDLLAQVRQGDVNRALLGDEFSAFLTPARLAVMSRSLVGAGEVTDVEAGAIRERGGMEVSTLRLLVGTTPASTLMYRSPDGKVQEFLFSRR